MALQTTEVRGDVYYSYRYMHITVMRGGDLEVSCEVSHQELENPKVASVRLIVQGISKKECFIHNNFCIRLSIS